MNWHDIILLGLAGLIALFGAPIIQLIKVGLSAIFKKEIKERWALLLAVVLAGGLAALEMFLTGQLKAVQVSLESFPAFFAAVFSLAQGYFAWFKNSDSAFGRGLLLKSYNQ